MSGPVGVTPIVHDSPEALGAAVAAELVALLRVKVTQRPAVALSVFCVDTHCSRTPSWVWRRAARHCRCTRPSSHSCQPRRRPSIWPSKRGPRERRELCGASFVFVSWRSVRTFNLDEYLGLPEGHAESYRVFMDRNLFEPLARSAARPWGLRREHTHFPQVGADYDALISRHGGLDVSDCAIHCCVVWLMWLVLCVCRCCCWALA